MTELTALADRIRRISTGQARIIDIRGLDTLAAATDALNAELAAGRDVDQFIIDAQQELDLYGNLGVAKTLLGYPVKVAYTFAED